MFAQRAKTFAKLPITANPHGYGSNAKKTVKSKISLGFSPSLWYT